MTEDASEHATDELAEHERLLAAVGRVSADISSLARNGHVPQAAARAASLAYIPVSIQSTLDGLVADGHTDEASIIELCWTKPWVFSPLRHAHRVGMYAAVLTFLAFVWPIHVFALLPAMAARLVASEVWVQWASRTQVAELGDTERVHARLLYDLSIYRTRGTNQLQTFEGALLIVCGLALFGFIVPARNGMVGSWGLWQLTLAGCLFLFAGVFAVTATRRAGALARRSVKPTSEGLAAPAAPAPPPPPPIERDSVLWKPRHLTWQFGMGAALCIWVAATSPDAASLITFGTFALVAAIVAIRSRRCVVLVGPGGVTSVGLIRTRQVPWSDVAQVRLDTERGSDGNQTLKLITRDGRTRTLARNFGKVGVNPELARIVVSMNHLAGAPDPGPTPQALRPRRVVLGCMVVLLVAFVLITLVVIFSKGSATADPAAIPAGRHYTVYQWADGSLSQPSVTCPSVADHLSGAKDSLCASYYEDSLRSVVILGVIDVALLVTVIVLIRAHRRLVRQRQRSHPSSAMSAS